MQESNDSNFQAYSSNVTNKAANNTRQSTFKLEISAVEKAKRKRVQKTFNSSVQLGQFKSVKKEQYDVDSLKEEHVEPTQPSMISSLQIRQDETFGASAIDHNTMKLVENTSQNSNSTNAKNIVIFDEKIEQGENTSSKNSSPVGLKIQQQSLNQTPIQVIARVRPQIKSEFRHPLTLEVVKDSVVNGHKTQIIVKHGLEHDAQRKIYQFEKVLDERTSQEQAFKDCNGAQLCNAFLNGQNCTIFVYGPTSTGKTFTMQGNAEDIIQRNHSPTSLNIDTDSEEENNSMRTPSKFCKRISKDQQNSTQRRKKEGNFNFVSDQVLRSARTNREDKGVSPEHNEPSIKQQLKYCQQLMYASKEKGVIQRVLDYVYQNFQARENLNNNCELKIAFLEIYNDQVNDLLQQQAESPGGRFRKQITRKMSTSSLDFRKMPDSSTAEKQNEPPQPTVPVKFRSKAKTLYGIGELEDLKNKSSSKFIYERKRSEMEDNNRQSGHKVSDRNKEQTTKASNFLIPGFGQFKTDKEQEISGWKETEQKKYTVKENAIKGVYVKNSVEVVCPTAESAYACLLKGLMRKRVSQTVRNTASSRSHTIFQIKMYMKEEDQDNQFLLPQYKEKTAPADQEQKLVSKFSLIDLAGSERITDSEKNQDRLDEAKFINKSLSALGNVVAALRTVQAKQDQKQQQSSAQNSANNTPNIR